MDNSIHIFPDVLLKHPDNTPERARFPVVDAHNHLFGEMPADEMCRIMDKAGIHSFINVTGNATLPYENNCYTIRRRDFRIFAENYINKYPGRFAAFTMADFAQWGDPVLIKDNSFSRQCIRQLEADLSQGACGLKVTKELGLYYTDWHGEMIAVDDERLHPIWHRAGELGIPVLIHVSDPVGFFLPNDEHNEHHSTLKEFPGWSFLGSHFSKWQLLEQRDRMISAHPDTIFILPHVANNPEDIDSVSTLLDRFPNVRIDFSARIDELGRQPYKAREFFLRYSDRIIFGIDMPVNPDIYRCYFRFLETFDEYFEYPDYVGRWGRSRWRIYGIGLPDDVLKKVYCDNITGLIPCLR